jgi:hypothetical protein
MKAPITSAQAMSHPTVVATINVLSELCRELREALETVRAEEREACIKLVHAGTGEPVQTKTLLILQKDRKRIEDAIRARGTT